MVDVVEVEIPLIVDKRAVEVYLLSEPDDRSAYFIGYEVLGFKAAYSPKSDVYWVWIPEGVVCVSSEATELFKDVFREPRDPNFYIVFIDCRCPLCGNNSRKTVPIRSLLEQFCSDECFIVYTEGD